MSNSSGKTPSKYKENKQQNVKESNTLDNKHRQMVKQFNQIKLDKDNIIDEITIIDEELVILNNKKSNITNTDITQKATLLDKKDDLTRQLKMIDSNYEEMTYYDITGDIITNYYDMRDSKEENNKGTKNIIEFLSIKEKPAINVNTANNVNRANLFEKYCQCVEGIRINHDDGSNRIKYCGECNIEKILDMSESAYICPLCGDSEVIILDEDIQIKDYSPYRRLNHFREWLNQFQAKQSPDIPDGVFSDIVKELNKNRITDLSVLNKKDMKTILKKLNYNVYYEHAAYIINKLNNLPPPKITRDMEKLFISMFFKIQEPWETHKQQNRKNFLSYSYVLHKFCELLELDHLLDCFPLHKDPDKIMENDQIWENICKHLKWEYISSFK